ncbi:hypothetical protein CRYUN_Cryun27aG0002700 [Craigia yunnanensis]
MFWDAFNPTQAVNAILACRAIYGPPLDSYPINIQQMTLINKFFSLCFHLYCVLEYAL